MKVRTGGKTVEMLDKRVRGGVVGHPVGRPNYTPRSMGPHEVQDVGTCPVAGSNPAPSPLPGWPKTTDKWNYAYGQFLELEKQAGNIKWWWYEPFSIWLAPPDKTTRDRGIRHKVDFMVWHNDGRLQMVEVKGHSRNLRDGITRFKIAREKFPCFEWILMKRKGYGWDEYR